ncbi:MAG: hypothetical protein JNJ73_04845 [Hyphomonadaceae bacterium]|nr:hypothetical protein [Hyphomonadaceae bacterium]
MRSALIVALAAALTLGAAPGARAENRADYCRYGQQSSLFLIDRTTPYDEADHRTLVESAGAVVDALGAGDRIVIATIGAHYSLTRRVFNECKPGCPPARNLVDSFNCAGVIAQRDERDFRRHLLIALRPLMSNTDEASNSDIVATIARTTQHPPGARSFTRIVIYSDMLENSQVLPWRDFAAMSPDAALARVRTYGFVPMTRAAKVKIVGFGRLHSSDRRPLSADADLRLRHFWTSYFTAGGASARDISFE